jgi:ABC-type transporter Mla subunit MlaD
MRSPSRLLVIGLVAVAAFVAVGLVLVQRVGKTYEDGLEVAADSAALAVDAAEPLASMTDNLVDFAQVAETGIEDARSIVASAQVSIAQLGESAETDLAETAEGLASMADGVAGVLESIERFIPGNRRSAAENLRQIADGLEPVPDDLRTLGAQLQETAAELEAVDPTLAELGTTVAALGDDLVALSPTIAELSATAESLAERVDDASDRVALDLWLARLVVLLLGAVFAVALVLLDRSRSRPDGVEASVDVDDLAGRGGEPV